MEHDVRSKGLQMHSVNLQVADNGSVLLRYESIVISR